MGGLEMLNNNRGITSTCTCINVRDIEVLTKKDRKQILFKRKNIDFDLER